MRKKIRKNGFSFIELFIVVILVGIVVGTAIPWYTKRYKVDSKEPNKPDWLTVSEYYKFPPAEEFKESPFYSMVWIGEASWIEKRFLLVKVERLHGIYGCVPYFAQALKEVEKKYNITARTPVRITPSESYAHTDGLLLEVKPK